MIRQRLTLEVVGPQGPVPAEAELRYNPVDPYAVTVAIPQGETEVVWVFGRDLLLKGVSAPVGDGDVRVFPSLDDAGHAVVGLMLRSPAGQALAKLPMRAVLDFLARSTHAVWPGTESDLINADDAIHAILVNG
jgi:hypothetical protein